MLSVFGKILYFPKCSAFPFFQINTAVQVGYVKKVGILKGKSRCKS